jgi:poly-gamma-glutamate capsule biosynthesis protein CapA/YwtB (metallophosphatase superfamily)
VDLRLASTTTAVTLARTHAAPTGQFRFTYRPRRERAAYQLRVVSRGSSSRAVIVRSRDVVLRAFGDANFGDGVANVMAQRGVIWPWRSVAPLLRTADISFGNLECSISRRGSRVPKAFNFRGSPSALRTVVHFAGLDVLNLANNHVGDYGTAALLDTVRSVRAAGAVPIGAGANIAQARRPQVIRRLGLRIAFVGFVDIGPTSFAAGSHKPGSVFASPSVIRADVRAARRQADVVIASFHWGIERHTQPTARQRDFARIALSAGATAVIAAHPHVLQPVVRPSAHRLIAYSLGNFVWSAGSALTSRTGILEVRLSARGVESARLRHAHIIGTRPRLG